MAAATPADTRITELIGLTANGRMVLWSTGEVRPISAFEAAGDDRYIQSGHYVIEWMSHAIAVHLGNYASGRISVQFMVSGDVLSMTRAQVEPLLLGIVVPDPVAAAEISAGLQQLLKDVTRGQDQPHRQQGAYLMAAACPRGAGRGGCAMIRPFVFPPLDDDTGNPVSRRPPTWWLPASWNERRA